MIFMNRSFTAIFGALLVVSLSANVYLYSEMNKFKDAWLNQFITTSEIESILKSSSTDLSLESIRQISISRFGKDSVHVVDLEDKFSGYGSDSIALGVNETLIFFKDGAYHGSKANLSNH